MIAVMEGERAQPRGVAKDVSFDALFRDEAGGVFRTLFAFTGGRADVAEDATAEAFARAFAQGDRLRDPIAWIYRVAFRVAIDELRRDKTRTQEREGVVPPPELVGVADALKRLSPNQRAAVTLRYVLDLDVAEVAHRMGTAEPTVRVHLFRARKRLRQLLGTEEVD
jgi:DNA-directed RNA polymerase specialized sigma24 family protein